MSNELEYMRNIVQNLSANDLTEYTPDGQNISDDMCMWLVNFHLKNKLSISEDQIDDLIDKYFDDIVVMLHDRCKQLNITFNNKLPQDYVATLQLS
jgi:hypothetical protein